MQENIHFTKHLNHVQLCCDLNRYMLSLNGWLIFFYSCETREAWAQYHFSTYTVWVYVIRKGIISHGDVERNLRIWKLKLIGQQWNMWNKWPYGKEYLRVVPSNTRINHLSEWWAPAGCWLIEIKQQMSSGVLKSLELPKLYGSCTVVYLRSHI